MNNRSKAIMNAIAVMLVLIALPTIMTACGPSGKMTQAKMIRVAEKTLEEKIRRTVHVQECLQQ